MSVFFNAYMMFMLFFADVNILPNLLSRPAAAI